MTITLDPLSGFCTGVTQAVALAEHELMKQKPLYCLGEIVHNEMEGKRLMESGLITIDRETFRGLKNCKVMIRAHGEPPETYRTAMENNITLIDASCPVVLRLQVEILEGQQEMIGKSGQVIIYGKDGHAEVLGLKGQTDGDAIVVRDRADLEKIDFSLPVRLFSQTTMDVPGLNDLVREIKSRAEMRTSLSDRDFEWKDTICRQVSNRAEKLIEFAGRFEVVIFVSGKNSSNGLGLYEVCKKINHRTYLVSGKDDLHKEWFTGVKDTGITGATSTPFWLMKEVENEIVKLTGE